MQNNESVREGQLKFFSIITGLFCAILLISTVTASKVVPFIGSLTIVGATLLFPIAFIFNDILTEVYGYRLSRKVIWTGFACQILAALSYYLIGLLPAASFWPYQDAYIQILGVVPRITVASLTAYFCGEFANSVVLSKMKYWAQGKRGLSQAGRFITSTIVGEGVDSVVFITIAFSGVWDKKLLITTILGIYIFKVIYEIIVTPFSTRIANWMKKVEGIDQIDIPERTSYNPFQVR